MRESGQDGLVRTFEDQAKQARQMADKIDEETGF
jgi:hypothetical protein